VHEFPTLPVCLNFCCSISFHTLRCSFVYASGEVEVGKARFFWANKGCGDNWFMEKLKQRGGV
jgi:hypothetical protein